MHYRQLGKTGRNVSVLSFGASSLGGVFRATDDAESIRTVHTALDLGINYFDTSPYYGNTRSETVLGKALRGVPRDKYILATKVGQYGDNHFDFSPCRVTASIDESCARLGIDYIDVIQCHDIEFADIDYLINETIPALQKLKQAGRVGYVGVTGLPLHVFRKILQEAPAGSVDTILSFCRYELNDTGLDELIAPLQAKGIGIINASPTGMGLLTERGVPSWHPAPPAMVEGAKRAVEFCRAAGVDIVKLAVQFCVADPRIPTTLVGTASSDNIRKNVEWAEAPIDFELMAKVLEILRPIKNHNFTRGRPENRDAIVG